MADAPGSIFGDGTLVLTAILGALLVERAVEIAINARNVPRLLARGARIHRPDGFGAIVIVHAALFVALPIEWIFAPWSGFGAWSWILVGVVAFAQALRYWVIATLGERWSVRVLTIPGSLPVTTGPYRWIRHPNYVAVVLEIAALPLAFGAIATALALSAANAVALARRIGIEERALRTTTRWGEEMESKARFLPQAPKK